MTKKPSYEELEEWVVELRKKLLAGEVDEALRKSRELFEKTFVSQRDAIFILNAEIPPAIVDCNPAAENTFGYSRHEMLGKDTEFLHISKDALAEFQKHLYPNVAEQGFFRRDGFMMKRKDGKLFPTEHTVMPLNDEKGERTGWVSVVRDVTARKNAEEAEKKISDVFRSVVEDMPALMCRFLPDGTLTFVNRSYCNYFGRSSEHLIGQNFFQFITQEARQEVKSRFTSLTRESPVVTYEHQVIASDGTRRWQQWTDRALFDEAGHLKEYQSLGLDVTDRKRAEEALREKEAIFSAFLEHSPIYVFFKDREIRSIHLSRNYEQMLGMPLHQAIGKTMDQLFPSDLARSMVEDDMRILHEGRRVDVVEELEGRIYETIKFPVFKDGVPFVLAGFTMDITERKQAEEALRESEKRYKQLFNHAPAGIYELDFHEQKFIAVNDIMCQFTGYSEEEFLSMSPYDILSEPGKALYAQRVSKLLTGENVSESVECAIITKDGGEIWVALNISLVYENGKVKGVTAVVHNITERRKVEQKLRQSEERLRSLSAELMKAQEKERTRISKELHDELGQSLAILKHRVRSIGKKLVGYQPQMSHDKDATVELVDGIIEKVRQISRDLNPSILEDVGLCAALRSLVNNFIQEYEISVSLDLDEIDAFFSKETARNLYRIFQEALTNIAKHADARHVNVHISKGPEYVYFLIEDDGKGFDTSEARARDEKRRGLGLPLMEERADLVGGTLEITSREGAGGTKILLTVPIEKGGIQ